MPDNILLTDLLNGGTKSLRTEVISSALPTNAATSEKQDAQTAVLNDILEQLELGNAPNILRNTGKNPPVGTILGANTTYDQPSIDRPNQSIPVGQTRIWVYADQNGVLSLKESHNGINWTTTSTLTVSAGITNIMGWTKLTKRYAKIEYVNGGVAQTEFILLQYFLGVGVTLIKADDGDIVTIGTKNDTAVTDPTASSTLIAGQKGILKQLQGNGVGALPTQLTGSNVQVGEDLTSLWLENALINTGVNVDVELPATLQGNAKYLIEIHNPSAVTALTVIAQNKAIGFGGDTRYPELTRWGVTANSSKCVIIEGFLLDSGSRLVISNDTALGAMQGFTASIRVISI